MAQEKYIKPPFKSKSQNLRFDSVQSGGQHSYTIDQEVPINEILTAPLRGSFFLLYDMNRAYPEYLVEFKTL